MIKRLWVDGYKSLKNLEINFSEGVTVFAGPNAAGKSNIIDLIKLVAATATKPIGEAFKDHRGDPIFAFDVRRIKQKSTKFSVEMDIRLSDESIAAVEKRMGTYRVRKVVGWKRYLRYSLTIGFDRNTGKLAIQEEELYPLTKSGNKPNSSRYYIKTERGHRILKMEAQARPKLFELGTDRTLLQEPLYVPHHPHVCALREELGRVAAYYFDPYSMRTETPIMEIDTLESSGTPLAAFINTMRYTDPEAFLHIQQDLAVFVEDITAIDIVRNPATDRLVLMLKEESGIPLPPTVISEGTLRFLGILALVYSPYKFTTLAIEEPENGVHTARLEVLATIFKNAAESRGIQFILTTHSPTLYRYFPLEGVQIIKKRGGYTQVISLVQALSSLGYKLDKRRARGVIGALLREDETLAELIDAVVTQR